MFWDTREARLGFCAPTGDFEGVTGVYFVALTRAWGHICGKTSREEVILPLKLRPAWGQWTPSSLSVLADPACLRPRARRLCPAPRCGLAQALRVRLLNRPFAFAQIRGLARCARM